MAPRLTLWIAAVALGSAAMPAAAQNAPPEVSTTTDRGVYVTQIGDTNQASISQAAPVAFARVRQDGQGNAAAIVQRDTATAYADLRQNGVLNDAAITQEGIGAGNVAYLTQTGSGNVAHAAQSATGTAENGAVLSQAGNANTMQLRQDGDDNLAQLSQTGDSNAMTAAQTGSGNRLTWSQLGNNLPNLNVVQGGGQAIQITQSR